MHLLLLMLFLFPSLFQWLLSLFFLLLCQLLFLDTRPGLLLSLIQTGIISSIIPGHHDVLEIFVLSCLMFVSYDK